MIDLFRGTVATACATWPGSGVGPAWGGSPDDNRQTPSYSDWAAPDSLPFERCRQV